MAQPRPLIDCTVQEVAAAVRAHLGWSEALTKSFETLVIHGRRIGRMDEESLTLLCASKSPEHVAAVGCLMAFKAAGRIPPHPAEAQHQPTVQLSELPPLQSGWVQIIDAEGRAYYFNQQLNKQQWDPPLADQAPPYVAPGPPPAAASGRWAEMYDAASGRPYYHNRYTGVIVWDKPYDYVAGSTAPQIQPLRQTSSTAPHQSDPSVFWKWQSDDAQSFNDFSPEHAARLEAAFQSGQRELIIPEKSWHFNFTTMIQRNTRPGGTGREIMRLVEQASVSVLPGRVQGGGPTGVQVGQVSSVASQVQPPPVQPPYGQPPPGRVIQCRHGVHCNTPRCTFHHASPAANYEYPNGILPLKQASCRDAAACSRPFCAFSHPSPAAGRCDGGGGQATGARYNEPEAAASQGEGGVHADGGHGRGAFARCIVLNGVVYKSLADHDPHSTSEIKDYGKLYNLDPPWQLCPKTADALHVCASYPWATLALVFADGSAHWTALPQIKGQTSPHYQPGALAKPDSGLTQKGGQYGVYACGDCGIPSHCGCLLRSDVLIMRNLILRNL
jgi:hypothetical protein